MSAVLESLAGVAGLAEIHDKVMTGRRLTFDDGVKLFRSRALAVAGGLANVVREKKNGNVAYFVRNMHLNPTNVCIADCKFCGFYRPYKTKEQGWTWDLTRALSEVKANLSEAITEVHIVGGHNPDYPYDYYLDLVRGIHELSPALHVKAFTCAEYDFFAKRFKKDLDTVIDDFKAAGVDSLPGGGAEVLVERVRRELYPKKISAERWLEVARATHAHGLRGNATMLYGHIETLEERVEHLCRLRALQDDTGGFMCFIPLAFHPENTQLAHLPGPTGFDDLMTIAVSRLMLDNFDHIKAYWIMISARIAQIGLTMGADDIDGTIKEEKIVHMAGATTPIGMSVAELCRLVRDAGCSPIQRDSVYNVVQRFDEPALA